MQSLHRKTAADTHQNMSQAGQHPLPQPVQLLMSEPFPDKKFQALITFHISFHAVFSLLPLMKDNSSWTSRPHTEIL